MAAIFGHFDGHWCYGACTSYTHIQYKLYIHTHLIRWFDHERGLASLAQKFVLKFVIHNDIYPLIALQDSHTSVLVEAVSVGQLCAECINHELVVCLVPYLQKMGMERKQYHKRHYGKHLVS